MAQQEDKTKRLLAIKEQIDQATSRADRLRGTLEQLESQFKQYGVKTLVEAKKKLAQMDAELSKSEKELNAGVEELEKAYEWA